jgi:hypothetical protein
MAPRNFKNLGLDLSKAKPHIYKNHSRVSKPPPKSTTTTNPKSRLNSLFDTYTQIIGENGSITLTTRLNDTTTMTSAPDGALTIHSRNGLMGLPSSLGMGLSELAFKWRLRSGRLRRLSRRMGRRRRIRMRRS